MFLLAFVMCWSCGRIVIIHSIVGRIFELNSEKAEPSLRQRLLERRRGQSGERRRMVLLEGQWREGCSDEGHAWWEAVVLTPWSLPFTFHGVYKRGEGGLGLYRSELKVHLKRKSYQDNWHEMLFRQSDGQKNGGCCREKVEGRTAKLREK